MERPEFKGKEIRGNVRGERKSKISIDGDVIITIAKSEEGVLISPRMRVYCKDAEGDLHQIGLLQNFELRSDVNDFEVSATAKLAKEMPGMSAMSKEALQTYRELLEHAGVNLNTCTCEVVGGGLGIDKDCPIHGIK